MNIPVLKESKHLLRGNLVIICSITQLFDRKSLIDDVGMVYNRILHKHLDELAHQLLTVVPHNGILIHRHAGVEGVVYQRVTHSLNINSVRAYLIIRVYLTVNRVSIDIKSEDLERISMHIQGVTLRKIHHYSTIGTHGIARHVVVFSEIARQLVLIDSVGIDNIIKGLADTCLFIVYHTVAHQRLALIGQHRAIE